MMIQRSYNWRRYLEVACVGVGVWAAGLPLTRQGQPTDEAIISYIESHGLTYLTGLGSSLNGELYLATYQVAPEKQALLLGRFVDTTFSVDRLLDSLSADPERIEWHALGADHVLQVTFDDRVEGDVGTFLFAVSDTGVRNILPEPAQCRPQELYDVDGDGELELLSYVESLVGYDCNHPCFVMLESRFEIPASWVTIDRWDGTEWVSVEREMRAFYRRLQGVYHRMGVWVDESCPTLLEDRPNVLADWEARAGRLGR